MNDLLHGVVREMNLRTSWPATLAKGVNVQCRSTRDTDYFFVMNFNPAEHALPLPPGKWIDAVADEVVAGDIKLGRYGVRVLSRKTAS